MCGRDESEPLPVPFIPFTTWFRDSTDVFTMSPFFQ